jgi:hypothetical protein
MIRRVGLLLVLAVSPLMAQNGPFLAFQMLESKVTVERRSGGEWCRIMATASADLRLEYAKIVDTLKDYAAYPKFFKNYRSVTATPVNGKVLLEEVMVFPVLGFENRKHLKVLVDEKPWQDDGIMISWKSQWTDGTIDQVYGYWKVRNLGDRTRLEYHTDSRIPVVMMGQSNVISMMLASELSDLFQALEKAAKERKGL